MRAIVAFSVKEMSDACKKKNLPSVLRHCRCDVPIYR